MIIMSKKDRILLTPEQRLEHHRKANRIYMRRVNARLKQERRMKRMPKLLAQGKCPSCEMILSSEFHKDCAYLRSIGQAVHEVVEIDAWELINFD